MSSFHMSSPGFEPRARAVLREVPTELRGARQPAELVLSPRFCEVCHSFTRHRDSSPGPVLAYKGVLPTELRGLWGATAASRACGLTCWPEVAHSPRHPITQKRSEFRLRSPTKVGIPTSLSHRPPRSEFPRTGHRRTPNACRKRKCSRSAGAPGRPARPGAARPRWRRLLQTPHAAQGQWPLLPREGAPLS